MHPLHFTIGACIIGDKTATARVMGRRLGVTLMFVQGIVLCSILVTRSTHGERSTAAQTSYGRLVSSAPNVMPPAA